MEQFAFEGAVIFELRLSVLGSSLQRWLRTKYRYTPDWPYFDPISKTEITAPSVLETELEFKLPTLPPKRRGKRDIFAAARKNLKEWQVASELLLLGVMNTRTYVRVDDLIDADARYQDRVRRHAADPTFPDPGPKL
jgi:hypothetical protein